MRQRILLVDDVSDDAGMIREVIENLGKFSFTHAKSRGEALALLNDDQYDIVVLDLFLDGPDGGSSQAVNLLHAMKSRLVAPPGTIIISDLGNHPTARKLEVAFPFVVAVFPKRQLDELTPLVEVAVEKALAAAVPEKRQVVDEDLTYDQGSLNWRQAAILSGVATLVFFMILVLISVFGWTVPCDGRFAVVVVLALGFAFSSGFVGGWAKAEGKIPFVGTSSPVGFAIAGGIGVFFLTLIFGWFTYIQFCL